MRDPYNIRLVITGLGTINSIGNTVEEFWSGLLEGKSGAGRIQYFDTRDSTVHIGAEVIIPDVSSYFKRAKLARRFDRYIVYSQVAGTQALRDSGLDIEKAPERYGVLISSAKGGNESIFSNFRMMEATGMRSTSPYFVVNSIPSSGSGIVSQNYNMQGPCFSVSSACASSNHSIGIAAMMIRMDMADAMLVGGAEAPVTEASLAAFGNINALSTRNEDPQTASRPFDADRDGFVLGEGGGVLCLEELEHAKKRGARIYCELKGFGFGCDAYDLVAPHPKARGSMQTISNALANARMEPDEIDLINAHATSTPIGDQAEYIAVRTIFGDYGNKVAVQSTKSMIGHLLGAAGGAEAIAAILAFERGVIHPTINQFAQDPNIGFNVIKGDPTEKKVDAILSNCFGFGGQNASIVLSRFKG